MRINLITCETGGKVTGIVFYLDTIIQLDVDKSVFSAVYLINLFFLHNHFKLSSHHFKLNLLHVKYHL